MPRFPLRWAALAAVALAACTDSQSPDESPSSPTSPSNTSLPVIETMRLTTPLAKAGGDYTVTLRFINKPTAAQRQFFEVAAAK